METAFECKRIRVVTHLPAHLPPVAMDADHMAEVFTHVLRNAMETSSEDGTVHIRAHYDIRHKSVRLDVADNGIGIPPENMKQIGQPFFTTKAGGVGLSLAITKRILTAHGGSFDFESRPDGGSTFVLRLPLLARRS